MDIDLEIANKLFSYDKVSGAIHCKTSFGLRKKGCQLDFEVNGRRFVSFGGIKYPAHRIAWGMVYGAIPEGMCIDHISGDATDNAINNLRLCTHQQNMMNRIIHKNNKSGCKGVYFDKSPKAKNKWRAQIRFEGVKFNIGRFPSKEAAFAAYIKTAKKLHGEFSRLS